MPNRCQPSPNRPSLAQSVAGAPTPTMAIQYTREGETSLEEKAYELADKILQEDSSNQNTREKLKKAILAGYNLHHEDFDD